MAFLLQRRLRSVMMVLVLVAMLVLVILTASHGATASNVADVASAAADAVDATEASSSALLKSFFNMNRVQHPNADDLLRFLDDDNLALDRPRGHSAIVTDFRNAALRAMSKWARTAIAQVSDKSSTTPSPRTVSDSPSSEFPYWRFVPLYVGSLLPDQPAVTWSAPCFQQNSGRVTSIANSTHLTVTLTLEDASSLFCSDMYALATLEGYVLKTFFLRGEQTFTWETADNVTAAELHDIAVRGVRVFVFSDSDLDTASELATTLELFASLETQGVPTATAELNVDFMAKYPQFKMTERSTQQVTLNESDIHSGDFFGVLRLDGLDPMLAWAMGSQTGHVTMALWIGGELYVVESTASSSYWPVNGVQRTPYAQWIEQARAAGYQLVHAPLTPEARAAFNETAAIEFFESVEGVDYGYQVLLWTWLDTVQDNFPCLPPDYTGCLTPSHMQVLFGYIDRTMPSVGDILFKQAWNKRVNTTDLSFAEVLQAADALGIPAEVLPTHVEQDSWTYATTRYNEPWEGPAMVCCVFVCRMWKAAGVFGAEADSINCAEQTNSDLYGLNVVQAPDPRPPQCVAADPANPLCQLEGVYTLQLTQFATHSPYPHMDETCPTLAPEYKRVDGC